MTFGALLMYLYENMSSWVLDIGCLKGGAGFAMAKANKKGTTYLIDTFRGLVENENYHKKSHFVFEDINLVRNNATNKAIFIGLKKLLSWKLDNEDYHTISSVLDDTNKKENIKDFVAGYKIHYEKLSDINVIPKIAAIEIHNDFCRHVFECFLMR